MIAYFAYKTKIMHMKTLSLISGIVLSMTMAAPASAYIGVYQPQSTVRMTYTQKSGKTKLTTSAMQKAPKQVKAVRSVPLTTEWPEWIGMPSWIGY